MDALTLTLSSGNSYTIPAPVMNSLESFRLSMLKPDSTPVYPDVPTMALGFLVDKLFTPALSQFPTPDVATALADLLSKRAAYEAALAASIAGSVA